MSKFKDDITVIKLDLQWRETWRYIGQVINRGETYVLLEAKFNRADTPFHGIVLRQGDRFVETFYSNRWYNIFEMYDREDNNLKGWYCNIGYPAIIGHDQVSYIDLALDLLVFPDGRQLVLDEEEFRKLPLSPEVEQQALEALHELQVIFEKKVRDNATLSI